MDSLPPPTLRALQDAGLNTPLDVLVLSPTDLSRRLNISDKSAQSILNTIARAVAPTPAILNDSWTNNAQIISTGDVSLDALLGGGLRTGALWELAGASSTGKTQLALQLSLMALIDPTTHTLDRSACYISSLSELPTERILQISSSHPALSPSHHTPSDILSHIHTQRLSDPDEFIHALSTSIPALCNRLLTAAPVKLLVIDSITPLLSPPTSSRATSSLLIERAQLISEASCLLRDLATHFNIAVLAINHVSDVFKEQPATSAGEMAYFKQAEWFARVPREEDLPLEMQSRKEATLGLSWANQIAARLMLSLPSRKRIWEDAEASTPSGTMASKRNSRLKRPRTSEVAATEIQQGPSVSTVHPHHSPAPTLAPSASPAASQSYASSIRRLAVIFSAFGPSGTIDYVIRTSGIITVSPSTIPQFLPVARKKHTTSLPPSSSNPLPPASSLTPLLPSATPKSTFLTDQDWEAYAFAFSAIDGESDEDEDEDEEQEPLGVVRKLDADAPDLDEDGLDLKSPIIGVAEEFQPEEEEDPPDDVLEHVQLKLEQEQESSEQRLGLDHGAKWDIDTGMNGRSGVEWEAPVSSVSGASSKPANGSGVVLPASAQLTDEEWTMYYAAAALDESDGEEGMGH